MVTRQALADPSRRISTLYEIAQLVSSSLELETVLARVMDVVVAVTGAERGFILLANGAAGLEVAVARNFHQEQLGPRPSGASRSLSRSLCERVFQTGESELIGDAQADQRTAVADSVVLLHLRSILCAPLRVRGKTIGVVYLDHTAERGRFSDRERRLLEAVGEQSAIAIENARLYEEVRRRARELADLQAYQDDVFRSVNTAIIGLDLTGHVISMNRAAEALFGARAAERRGAPYTAVLGEQLSARLLRHFAAAGAGHASAAAEIATHLVGVERTLRCAVAPLRDGDGSMTGLVFVAEDETARVAAERARAAAERQRELVEQEMRLARDIQLALLPRSLPTVPGWRLAAHYRPARAVGGDLYDCFQLADGRLAVVVADVTGKGMAAALLMAAARTAIHAAARSAASPAELLRHVNEQLLPTMPRHMFVTCLCLAVDATSGRLRYASAGHLPPLRRSEGGVVELGASGVPLGVAPVAAYDECAAVLSPGDALLLYSDGLVEAHDAGGRMFGFDGLAAALAAVPHGAAPTEVVLGRLAAFTGPAWEQEDDLTVVSLVRERSEAGVRTSHAGTASGEHHERRDDTPIT